MTDLAAHINRTIRTRKLFRPGQSILAAVSGGVDSMVLLEVLHELAGRNRWSICVAHLNHKLRGSSSNRDERLVRTRASRLGFHFHSERIDIKQLAPKSKISIEMAARKLRHEFLARTAKNLGIKSIALAHHADDQIELFFIRLFRGSGPEGLAGMNWSSPSSANPAITLCRPLLDLPKSALLAFAKERNIRFHEDATNASEQILRNRIRHELLPLLRSKYQPGLDKSVVRVMSLVGADSESVSKLAKNWVQTATRPKPHALPRKPRLPFEKLDVAVQRAALNIQLLALGVNPNFDLIEHLRQRPGVPVAVSGKDLKVLTKAAARPNEKATAQCFLVRENSRVLIRRAVKAATFNDATSERELNLRRMSGSVDFKGLNISWQILEANGQKNLRQRKDQECFDADKIGAALTLRHWRPGDRFQPIGMSQTVKLQDFFTNSRILRELRHKLILAAAATGEVFWVEGLRISENFKVTSRTIRRLQWRWHRL